MERISRLQAVAAKLKGIEVRVCKLEGTAPPGEEEASAKLSLMDKLNHPDSVKLHGSPVDQFQNVKSHIAQHLGTKADSDDKEQNAKLKDFIDGYGDVNFYTYATLLYLDDSEGSTFGGLRSYAKIILLPCFQVLVPLGMLWYYLVEKDSFADGYCSADGSLIYRGTGLIAFMYSAWQIIDGCYDESARYFLQTSSRMYAMTGGQKAWEGMWLFYLGNLTQQICSICILVMTFVLFNQPDNTPLDLLMNCVAINFVLDIDSEWMDSGKQVKSTDSSVVVYKYWRDICEDYEAEVKSNMNYNHDWRRRAPVVLDNVREGTCNFVWVFAYCLVSCWTICPAGH